MGTIFFGDQLSDLSSSLIHLSSLAKEPLLYNESAGLDISNITIGSKTVIDYNYYFQ